MKTIAKRIVGVDLGNTVFYTKKGVKVVYDDAFRVIRRLSDDPYVSVAIVSKVNEEQKRRALDWFVTTGFLDKTKLALNQIHFCQERADKAEIATRLGLTHHIDDRPEVMSYMSRDIEKYLFRPNGDEVVKFYNQLKSHTIRVVNTWCEFEQHFFR